VPFIGKAHGDAVGVVRPQFLDQAVSVFGLPLAGKKRFDRAASLQECAAVSP
jgi:hypothetical protein